MARRVAGFGFPATCASGARPRARPYSTAGGLNFLIAGSLAQGCLSTDPALPIEDAPSSPGPSCLRRSRIVGQGRESTYRAVARYRIALVAGQPRDREVCRIWRPAFRLSVLLTSACALLRSSPVRQDTIIGASTSCLRQGPYIQPGRNIATTLVVQAGNRNFTVAGALTLDLSTV